MQWHLSQERSVRDQFSIEKRRVAAVYKFLDKGEDSAGDGINWEEIQSCRVFANEEVFLGRSVGWYGRRLAEDCWRSIGEEIVGIYQVVEGRLAREVRYLYIKQDIIADELKRVGAWESSWEDETLMLKVEVDEREYQYLLPNISENQSLLLLQSVASEGFYLLVGSELWLLPNGVVIPCGVIGIYGSRKS